MLLYEQLNFYQPRLHIECIVLNALNAHFEFVLDSPDTGRWQWSVCRYLSYELQMD